MSEKYKIKNDHPYFVTFVTVGWILFLFSLFISCSSSRTSNQESELAEVYFASVLDKEKCTLYLNDSLIFKDADLITERSLGFSQELFLKTKADITKLSIEFNGYLIPEAPNIKTRSLKLDTVLDLRKKKNVLIEARVKNIEVEQWKGIRKFE